MVIFQFAKCIRFQFPLVIIPQSHFLRHGWIHRESHIYNGFSYIFPISFQFSPQNITGVTGVTCHHLPPPFRQVQVDELLSKLSGSTSYEALADCDIVVEARDAGMGAQKTQGMGAGSFEKFASFP
jgi:hypothetical protein